MRDAKELCFTPAIELRPLLQAGDLSPVELVNALLGRIERLNPLLHAYLTVSADAAPRAGSCDGGAGHAGRGTQPARRPPLRHQGPGADRGGRTIYGSKWFEHHGPAEDGAVAVRLKAASGILLGKTNTPHVGYKDTCDRMCSGRRVRLMQTAATRPDPLAGDSASTLIWGIVASIVHAVDPLAIVLFGSRARGDHRPGSDVDLLVVVPEELSTRKVCGMLDRRRALADVPLGVDLVVATPARLAAARGDYSSVLHWAQEQGVELYRASAMPGPEATEVARR